ncbi:MAG: hypothetical protein R6X34_10150 [Chloroflexota bacterium]
MSENNEDTSSPGTNMRRYREESDKKLLFLVIFTLVALGSGLIGLIFGWQALLTSLPCLFGGALLILIPWGLLSLAEKWRQRMEV